MHGNEDIFANHCYAARVMSVTAQDYLEKWGDING